MIEISMEDYSPNEPDEFEYMYRHIETIASGSFGTVIKAFDLHNQKEVAVKIIRKENHKKALLKQIEQEVEILEQLNHKHIVHFENCIETKHRMYIIMEYCAGGSLKAYLDKNACNLTETTAKVIITSLLSAVNYLHQRDICHRDIKPENIMLKDIDDINSIKLVDFGLSAQFFEYKGSFENCGTLLYMAPEQIHNKTYSKGIDVWSVGIILFMMLNGNKHPFWTNGDNRKDYIAKLKELPMNHSKDNISPLMMKVYGNCSEMAKSLMSKLLECNPSFRYSIQNALEHPWISGRKYDPIPKTVFEKLKDEEIKKKMILLFNAVIFIKKYNTKTNDDENNHNNNKEMIQEYIDKINQTSIKSKEKIIMKREKEFVLGKDSLCTIAIGIIRPSTQNPINNNNKNNLLFKLNHYNSKGDFLQKGKKFHYDKDKNIENNKDNYIKSKCHFNPNPNITINNHSLDKKDFVKKISRGFNFPSNKEIGFIHHQPNSSKNLYLNKVRNTSSYKKNVFNEPDDSKILRKALIRDEISPFIEKKKTMNPLIKIKIPFKKSAVDSKIKQNKTINIKNDIRGLPVYLPKIVF